MNILTNVLEIPKLTRYRLYNKGIDKRNNLKECIHGVKRFSDNKRKERYPSVYFYLKIKIQDWI